MKIYKVRHKVSGLFYKGKGDWDCLVPDGKWYKTKNTYLTYLENRHETMKIDMRGRLYKKNHDIFEKCLVRGVCKINESWHTLDFDVSADDFELIEYDVLLTNPKVIK